MKVASTSADGGFEMKLLAIDTATEQCSAAVWTDGVLFTRSAYAPRQHATQILPMVEAVLNEAQCALAEMDGIAFGRGPGAFTGVRLAVSVAQGLAFAIDKPVIPISTLAALACGTMQGDFARTHGPETRTHRVETRTHRPKMPSVRLAEATLPPEDGTQHIAVAIDARMSEVYFATYTVQSGQLIAVGAEQVCAPARVTLPYVAPWYGVGTGWKAYAPVWATHLPDITPAPVDHFPEAAHIAQLAAATDPATWLPADQALPVYLRNEVAATQKHVPFASTIGP